MRVIVDTRTHLLPRVLLPKIGRALNPLSHAIHKATPLLQPLLAESTAEDLDSEMRRNKVSFAFVVAHPPFVTNQAVLSAASRFSGFVSAMNIPTTESNPDRALESLVEKGGRLLKIRADESQVDSQHHHRLLCVANEQRLPVMLEPHRKPLAFRRAHHFEPWFKRFPKIKFLLTQPDPDLCRRYSNVWMDTAWQAMQDIAQAIKRCGASKILLASDWPLGRSNQRLAIQRILEAEQYGMISTAEADRILGKNALELLGLSSLWNPRQRRRRSPKDSSSSSSSSSTLPTS